MENKDLKELEQKASKEIAKATDEYLTVLRTNGYSMEDSSFKVNKTTVVGIYSEGGDEWLPQYATTGSSGMDLRAYIKEPITLQPLERKLIPTGIYVDLPDDTEFQIRPRSGLSYKKGLTLINCTGTIDDDYIGQIFVALINFDPNPQTIVPKERIAQMIIAKVEKCEWEKHDTPENFNAKNRSGGFGSTGKI